MDKITADDIKILGNMSKIKDIRKYIIKNYNLLDYNDILKDYLNYRGLTDIRRKTKNISEDMLKKIRADSEDILYKIEEMNKREGFNRGFKMGLDEGNKEGYERGLAEGLKRGVEKAMTTFIRNNMRCEDLLKIDEYVELVRN